MNRGLGEVEELLDETTRLAERMGKTGPMW